MCQQLSDWFLLHETYQCDANATVQHVVSTLHEVHVRNSASLPCVKASLCTFKYDMNCIILLLVASQAFMATSFWLPMGFSVSQSVKTWKKKCYEHPVDTMSPGPPSGFETPGVLNPPSAPWGFEHWGSEPQPQCFAPWALNAHSASVSPSTPEFDNNCLNVWSFS